MCIIVVLEGDLGGAEDVVREREGQQGGEPC